MDREFYFSTKALIMKDNRFLAMYVFKEDKKVWDLPGGRMEFGESAEETLSREIKEELSVDVIPIKLIDTWNYMHTDYFQITGVIYLCEILDEDIVVSEEHDGFEWIKVEDIGKIFTRDIYVERMNNWNWTAVIDKKSICTNLN